MTLLIKQPPVQNVKSQGRAILNNLDMGDRCDSLVIHTLGNIGIEALKQIKVQLGGKTIVDITGDELVAMNRYMGRVIDNNAGGDGQRVATLWFANPNAKTLIGYEQGAIETDKGYSSFQVEFDVSTSSDEPEIEIYMRKGPPKVDRNMANKFRSFLRSNVALNKVGDNRISPPLGESTNLISRVHMFTSDATHLEIKKQGLELLSKTPIEVIRHQQKELNRDSVASYICWDSEELNHTSDQVSQLRQLSNGNITTAAMQFNVTASAIGTMDVVGEVIGDISSV